MLLLLLFHLSLLFSYIIVSPHPSSSSIRGVVEALGGVGEQVMEGAVEGVVAADHPERPPLADYSMMLLPRLMRSSSPLGIGHRRI